MGNIRQVATNVSNSGTSLVLTFESNTIAGTTLLCFTAAKVAVTVSSVVGTHDSLASIDNNT